MELFSFHFILGCSLLLPRNTADLCVLALDCTLAEFFAVVVAVCEEGPWGTSHPWNHVICRDGVALSFLGHTPALSGLVAVALQSAGEQPC